MIANQLADHLVELRGCARCPNMIGPVVTPPPIVSSIYLIGQAPGPREGSIGRPFAWTAGKTLFSWFARLGVDEDAFRRNVYIAAVCRCFPGKTAQGGDRVPLRAEIDACSDWMRREIELLRPRLIIPVGRLAIARVLPVGPLEQIIGRQYRVEIFGHACDAIPLPHPSGASPWHKLSPGKELLGRALLEIGTHAAWREHFGFQCTRSE